MAGSNNNGRGGGSKKKLADQYKEVCPPHKRKDLDALIKAQNGDEDKIMQSIQEWWEEPATVVEPAWEEINKKAPKKKIPDGRGSIAGRGRGRGGGRGGAGRGGVERGRRSGGGRGRGREGGREGGGRGREGRGASSKPKAQESAPETATTTAPVVEPVKEMLPPGVPIPVAPPAPQGAWGQPAPAVEQKPVPPPPPPPIVVPVEPPVLVKPVEMDVVAPSSPQAAPSPVRSGGNVWATKGSAHLIKKENTPKPRTTPHAPPAAPPVTTTTSRSHPQARVGPPKEQMDPLAPPPNALESGLSASVNGANINAAGWKPSIAETSQLDSLGTTMAQTIVKETPAPLPKPEPTVTASKPPPPTNVLNMGHWETGDNDETQNLDFGFGSFGAENDTPSVGETTMSGSTGQIDSSKDTTAQTSSVPAASPARPPPGLSIGGGAPSLPAGAVLVSDLESKLEGTSVGQQGAGPGPAQSEKTAQPLAPNAPPGVPPPGVAGAGQILPQTAGMNQNYNTAYGMGMYNYNAAAAAGNGFVAGMHGGQVLAGGIPPKQQAGIAGQAPSSASGVPHLPQAGGLYGAPAGQAPSDTNADTAGAPGAATSMPPGMPNAMPAYNPALFYGQQPYQMGQPHGVGGYGYGYGAQFGGAVQGGFGYQQGMMGQTGGYPYDDQQQQGNTGGYQKNNSGGYRGRGSGNQYQNQGYNPQGAYAGQPYGMGYHGDHFNQRGGYGPAGGMDPYGAMQQQQGSGNFGGQTQSFQNNDDDHHKGGKKVGGRNNGSQFQQQQHQQHPQQLGGQQGQQQQGQQQQQSFGRQGGDSNTNSNAGWSNQAQAGGWGGQPSWQQGS
eukprot:CAMPEP_0119005620 /NCGR_PEP_ID=MMETSP1176-20130426/1833_1 /TAXON_ID=265551 /ORGANISM="Synedropsis recta cf, Strain CCMP1620" /LENGTH=835 /DNA_ID=CAMNT_0006957453 /DNA_START=100 /DNA_END=2610 /DNA_ORIENTATION=+